MRNLFQILLGGWDSSAACVSKSEKTQLKHRDAARPQPRRCISSPGRISASLLYIAGGFAASVLRSFVWTSPACFLPALGEEGKTEKPSSVASPRVQEAGYSSLENPVVFRICSFGNPFVFKMSCLDFILELYL